MNKSCLFRLHFRAEEHDKKEIHCNHDMCLDKQYESLHMLQRNEDCISKGVYWFH